MATEKVSLKAMKPDLGIVVSYGVILKPELLALPKLGMINAHASLLPLYRGAAPIQWAIRDGRAETGVTIMRIAEALDAGDVLLTKATPIDPKENAGSLRERLAAMSGEALVEACELIEKGKAEVVTAPVIRTEIGGGLEWGRIQAGQARPDRQQGKGDAKGGVRKD